MKKFATYIMMLALGLGTLTSCNEDPVLPPVPVPPVPGGIESIGNGDYNKPLSSWQVLRGYTEPNENAVWMVGYIVGWIDTDASASFSLEKVSARFEVPSGSETNILVSYELPWLVKTDANGDYEFASNGQPEFIYDSEGKPVCLWNVKTDAEGHYLYILPDGTESAEYEEGAIAATEYEDDDVTLKVFGDDNFWEKCTPVQLPSGGVRTAVNLTTNPRNLGKQVCLKGSSGSKYCGAYGMRDTAAFNWGAEGYYEKPVPPVEPVLDNQTFVKVDKFEGAGSYLLVFGDKIAGPVEPSTYSYGYFPTKSVTVSDNKIVTSTLNAFTFYSEEGEEGYEIRDGYGRYVWWQSGYSSFQLSLAHGQTGDFWTVTAKEDGTFDIKNIEFGLSMQNVLYNGAYTVGAYNNNRGTFPTLYKLEK